MFVNQEHKPKIDINNRNINTKTKEKKYIKQKKYQAPCKYNKSTPPTYKKS